MGLEAEPDLPATVAGPWCGVGAVGTVMSDVIPAGWTAAVAVVEEEAGERARCVGTRRPWGVEETTGPF